MTVAMSTPKYRNDSNHITQFTNGQRLFAVDDLMEAELVMFIRRHVRTPPLRQYAVTHRVCKHIINKNDTLLQR